MAFKNGQSRETGNIWYTRYRAKTNKTKNTTQKTKTLCNTDPTKNLELIQVHMKNKQFLPLIRLPPCYLFSHYVLDTIICKQTYIVNKT